MHLVVLSWSRQSPELQTECQKGKCYDPVSFSFLCLPTGHTHSIGHTLLLIRNYSLSSQLFLVPFCLALDFPHLFSLFSDYTCYFFPLFSLSLCQIVCEPLMKEATQIYPPSACFVPVLSSPMLVDPSGRPQLQVLFHLS